MEGEAKGTEGEVRTSSEGHLTSPFDIRRFLFPLIGGLEIEGLYRTISITLKVKRMKLSDIHGTGWKVIN